MATDSYKNNESTINAVSEYREYTPRIKSKNESERFSPIN